MNISTLKQTAKAMIAPGKGILAADESAGTIKKRLEKINVQSNPDTNLVYRKMLFTTPGIEEFISGVILYDETIRQSISTEQGKSNKIPVPQYLTDKGILPGIKVDQGKAEMVNSPGEHITKGLDGLRDRLVEYRNMGAKFAKWRAVIAIGADIPTDASIKANAKALAEYASFCQEQDIVPIVEPEVLMDGKHDLQKCQEVTTKTLKMVFDELKNHEVILEGMLLKPNMVISGKESSVQASSKEIAQATIETFLRVVPREVPGIVFLSGGQTPDEATENLKEINLIGGPWQLSFSYGRALQEETLKAWAGKEENVAAAQRTFLERCKKVSVARSAR
ncbi:fructose-bisphosphate aldolase class I [Patescibacteria group bacterium]|nr:fructose-bisphosphate aldolase class I [Patescibacteria group bacterium]